MPEGSSAGRSSLFFSQVSHSLVLQGISELIKRIAAVRGYIQLETKYEKPLQ